MSFISITRVKQALITNEFHLIFIAIIFFSVAHFYFMFDSYMSGYKRFMEIWYAILKFTGYLLF